MGKAGANPGTMQVVGILLAAGEGRRFGGNKQLAQLGGMRLIEHALRAVSSSGLRETFVVLGARAHEIAPYVNVVNCVIVENPRWPEGIGASIKRGFAAARTATNANVSGVLVAVSDQPHLSAEHIDRLILLHRSAPTKIIASSYSDQVGTPAIFPRSFFAELEALPNGTGAKGLIHAHLDQTLMAANELLALDIDTPQDLQNWVEKTEYRPPGIGRTDDANQC